MTEKLEFVDDLVVMSPSEFQGQLKDLVKTAFKGGVVLEGVITGFKQTPTGHVQGDLQDVPKEGEQVDKKKTARVAFWFWKFNWNKWKRDFYPSLDVKDFRDKRVRITGQPSSFDNGNVFLAITHIELLDKELVESEREKTRKKLEAEGLFAKAQSKPLPKRVSSLAVLSGRGSAAFLDLATSLKALNPFVKIYFFPTLVQGDLAPQSIADRLTQVQALQEQYNFDLVLISRGGGSNFDLSAFDTEVVLRAIANCPLPVAVAVGHSTDHTLAEMASNLTAITPTESATKICGYNEVDNYKGHLALKIETLTNALGQYLTQRADYLAELDEIAGERIENRLSELDKYIENLEQLLDHLDPQKLLSRGYALVTQKGQLVTSVKDYDPSQPLQITLCDGEIVFPAGQGKEKSHG